MIYFFDVPVYRVSAERYYAERDAHIRGVIRTSTASDENLRSFYEQHPDDLAQHEDHLRSNYGGCWNYNEVIGYIRLHLVGRQVRGEYYGVMAKRIVRSRKKVFKQISHKLAPELGIPPDAPNAIIFGIVGEYLDRCKRELPGRHIDTETLDNIGPYIDWRALLRMA